MFLHKLKMKQVDISQLALFFFLSTVLQPFANTCMSCCATVQSHKELYISSEVIARTIRAFFLTKRVYSEMKMNGH